MAITGNISCTDNPGAFIGRPFRGLSGYYRSILEPGTMDTTAYPICRTDYSDTGKTFVQEQLLLKNDLPLNLQDSTFVGGTLVDGTYVGSIYRIRQFDPIWINYGLFYTPDGTNWVLEGYRYRTPLHDGVGRYHANFEAPMMVGEHKIQWLYQKDQSSCVRAIDMFFNVDFWGNQPNKPSIYPPSPTTYVITIPTYAVKHQGDTVVFTLVPYGNMPAPLTYQWRQNGWNITDGLHFSGTQTDTLTITNLTPAETGFLDCVISNTIVSSVSWLMDP